MGALDKQVTITFNLRKAVMLLTIIALLLGVFFVGRCSAPADATTESEVAVQQESIFSKILSSFSSSDDEDADTLTATVTAPVEEEPIENETVEEVVEEEPEPEPEPVVEEEEEEPEEEEPETFVTEDYSKVTLDISKVEHEWFGDWGKATKVSFKIDNKESGTIKPVRATVQFEGYLDQNSKIEGQLPLVHQSIKKDRTQFSNIELNFPYAESATDPTNIKVYLTLLDVDGDIVASVNEEFDLTVSEVN